jgi:flagellar hook-associated protein 2
MTAVSSLSGPVSLSGLASGVDTSGIIDKLMAVDQQQITSITNKATTIKGHQAELQAVNTALNTLSTAAAALNDPATWKSSQSVESSDPKVGATILSGAGIGGHTIQVDRLASSAQQGFTYTPSATAGTLSLYYGSDPTAAGASKATINVGANATATDVATALNNSTNSPVYAAVIKAADGTDRLVLSARKSGQSSDFTVDTSAMAGGTAVQDASYTKTGAVLNALYSVDGSATQQSSETNVLDNAVAGIRLTLKGVTTSPASISTDVATINKDDIKAKAKAFVDAYNSLVDLTRGDIAEKPVANASTAADLITGTLFGDLGLQGMLSSLKDKLTSSASGLGSLTSLSDIGIGTEKATGGATSDDAKAGKLVFDDTVLDTALDKDFTQVKSLFTGVGTTKGFSGMITDYVQSQTGTQGVLTSRIQSDTSSLTDNTNLQTTTQTRLDAQETRLKAQFAAMETAMQNAQSQQAWLTGEIASLPTYG